MDDPYFLQASKVQTISQHDPFYLLNVEMPKDLSFLHVYYPISIVGMSSSIQDYGNSYTKHSTSQIAWSARYPGLNI
jgi:hypothetical protein